MRSFTDSFKLQLIFISSLRNCTFLQHTDFTKWNGRHKNTCFFICLFSNLKENCKCYILVWHLPLQISWSRHLPAVSVFWSFYRSVDCDTENEEDDDVEDAEDGQTTIIGVIFRTWNETKKIGICKILRKKSQLFTKSTVVTEPLSIWFYDLSPAHTSHQQKNLSFGWNQHFIDYNFLVTCQELLWQNNVYIMTLNIVHSRFSWIQSFNNITKIALQFTMFHLRANAHAGAVIFWHR